MQLVPLRNGDDEEAGIPSTAPAAAPDGASEPQGMEAFQAWFSKLVMRNERTFAHADYPGTVFVGRDTVLDLYKVFNVEATPGGKGGHRTTTYTRCHPPQL
jgi:hypothetical protein